MSSSSEQLSAGTQLSERVEARWSVVAQDPAQPRAIAVGVVVCRFRRTAATTYPTRRILNLPGAHRPLVVRIRHPLVPKQW